MCIAVYSVLILNSVDRMPFIYIVASILFIELG